MNQIIYRNSFINQIQLKKDYKYISKKMYIRRNINSMFKFNLNHIIKNNNPNPKSHTSNNINLNSSKIHRIQTINLLPIFLRNNQMLFNMMNLALFLLKSNNQPQFKHNHTLKEFNRNTFIKK